MQYLFLAFGGVAIAAFASIKFTISLVLTLILITLVVKLSASVVIGSVSLGDSFKAATMAVAFLGLAILWIIWAFKGEVVLVGVWMLVALAVLFAAFVLGFKNVFGANFSASSTIAVVSTSISGVLLYLLRPYLF